MKITIIYDTEVHTKGLKADWGFSCLVEAYNRKILFDTGASGSLLLENMDGLGIDPAEIDEIFISHPHFDHTGGLTTLLRIKPVKVYVPQSFGAPSLAKEVIRIKNL
ncbi:MAG: MBL fold metallo-hydrolase, partial [Methermicoccaceae archaeon]